MSDAKAEKCDTSMPQNVFVRVFGYIKNYGFLTTVFMIKNRQKQGTLPARGGLLGLADRILGGGNGNKNIYEGYIENTERNVFITERLEYKPLFSFVIPVYNVEERLLRECIDSVLAQTFDNFELILVDDCSTIEDVPRTLESYRDNEKITVIYREENGHISRCTNTGIAAAKGEYIVFMDCDDTIAPNTLYELTRAVNADRTTDLIYTDEDKLDENGRRHYPHFKPDWSPDTLMSHMYISHLSAYRRSIVNEIGGLRPGFEGAQDYDLTLRFTEKTNRVCHIPKVLYHWRIRTGSTAGSADEKPYVKQAVLKLKQEALERRGIKGNVVYIPDVRQYRVVYAMPDGENKISIIIPSKDNFDILERCIVSIAEKTRYKNYEIIVVDNGSCLEQHKKYAALCEKYGAVYIYKKEDFNFSKMCNDGARAAKGEYLLFLNDDTEVTDGSWLEIMAGQAALEHTGAVGAKLLYPGGFEIQHCGVVNIDAGPSHAFNHSDDRAPLYFRRNKMEYNWIAVTAACLCIKRAKFDGVGGFDETFPVAYNDVELCFRLCEAGLYNVVRNDVILYHYESVSRGNDAVDKEKIKRLARELGRLYKKHPNFDRRDPFYNPAFSKTRPDFMLDSALYGEPDKIVRTNTDITKYISPRVKAELRRAKDSSILNVTGYAYVEGAVLNNLNTCRLLLVDAKNKAVEISAEKMLRFDISVAYGKNGNLNLTGLECHIHFNDLPKGSYRLGVMLINCGKKYARVFDETVDIH